MSKTYNPGGAEGGDARVARDVAQLAANWSWIDESLSDGIFAFFSFLILAFFVPGFTSSVILLISLHSCFSLLHFLMNLAWNNSKLHFEVIFQQNIDQNWVV